MKRWFIGSGILLFFVGIFVVGTIISTRNGRIMGIFPTPSPEVRTVYVYVTPKPTSTPRPENPEDYGLPKGTWTYNNFVKAYNRTVNEWINYNTSNIINLEMTPDVSVDGEKQFFGESIRHQLNSNTSMSVGLMGRKPFISYIILLCSWNSSKDQDNSLAAYALVDLISNKNKDLWSRFPKMKTIDETIDGVHYIIKPTSKSIRVEISFPPS